MSESEWMKNPTHEQAKGLSVGKGQVPLCMPTFWHRKVLLHPLLLLCTIFGSSGPKLSELMAVASGGAALLSSAWFWLSAHFPTHSPIRPFFSPFPLHFSFLLSFIQLLLNYTLRFTLLLIPTCLIHSSIFSVTCCHRNEGFGRPHELM